MCMRWFQSGTTLIELMVSLVILVMGLLGLISLQVKVQQADIDNFQRAQALMLAEDMVNRMHASPDSSKHMCYDTSEFTYLPGEWTLDKSESLDCTGSVAEKDLIVWNEMLRGNGETMGSDNMVVGGLIGAVGCIERDSEDTSLWYVSVAWQGLSDVPLPENASRCGSTDNRFESDTRRRLVTLPLRFIDW